MNILEISFNFQNGGNDVELCSKLQVGLKLPLLGEGVGDDYITTRLKERARGLLTPLVRVLDLTGIESVLSFMHEILISFKVVVANEFLSKRAFATAWKATNKNKVHNISFDWCPMSDSNRQA